MPRRELSDTLIMIVAGRVRGEPVTKIAEKIGTTRTYVYNILSIFPGDRPFVEGGHSFSEEDEIFIASRYLSAAPPFKKRNEPEWKIRTDETVADIAKSMKCSEDEVRNVLSKMRCLHASVSHSPYYPQIEVWRKRNAVSLKSLAKDCGINAATLKSIFDGQLPMPLAVAERISERSGLPLSKIYGKLIRDQKNRESKANAPSAQA